MGLAQVVLVVASPFLPPAVVSLFSAFAFVLEFSCWLAPSLLSPGGESLPFPFFPELLPLAYFSGAGHAVGQR
jgi:hypothetical protein